MMAHHEYRDGSSSCGSASISGELPLFSGIIMKKDTKNEYIGIISLIVIVILAVIAIYYLSHQPIIGPKELNNAATSLETRSYSMEQESLT